MTTLKMPFQGNNFKEVYNNVLKCKYSPLPKMYSKDLDFIIKNHNYFRQIFHRIKYNSLILMKKEEPPNQKILNLFLDSGCFTDDIQISNSGNS